MADKGTGSGHSSIPGEATLYNLLPKGYTLMGMIVAGVAYGAWAYSDIIANAEDVQEIKQWTQEQTPRIRILEQNQGILQEQLKHMDEQMDRAEKDARTGRAEIIDALKDLKQDMRRQ